MVKKAARKKYKRKEKAFQSKATGGINLGFKPERIDIVQKQKLGPRDSPSSAWGQNSGEWAACSEYHGDFCALKMSGSREKWQELRME